MCTCFHISKYKIDTSPYLSNSICLSGIWKLHGLCICKYKFCLVMNEHKKVQRDCAKFVFVLILYIICLFSRWISVEGHQKCLTTICICICIHKNINVCSCLLVIWKTRIEGQQGREILLLNSSLGRSRSASWNIKQI